MIRSFAAAEVVADDNEKAGVLGLVAADDVRGRALDCGHFLAEEAPEETYEELRAFFAGG